MNYIVYHTKRCVKEIGDLIVYHDSFVGNQDPYIWNKKFLHTFCHMTQLKVKEKDVIFWVSRDISTNFTELYCDCIFVIEEKLIWNSPNTIDIDDSIVDNQQTYEHHYKWAKTEHQLLRKKRYTLKANSEKSCQPQTSSRELIDIVPFLNLQGISTEALINDIFLSKNGKRLRNTKPFKLTPEVSYKLYDFLWETSKIKLTGEILENIHPNKFKNP